MITLAPPPRRRRPGLTPMVDVVFLLLVFFMLAARFGVEDRLPLALAVPGAGGTAYAGPPRLVDVGADGLRLNGQPIADLEALVLALGPLMADPADAVVLRAREGAALQDMVRVLDGLGRAGLLRLVLVE